MQSQQILYVHVLEYRFSHSRYLWNSTFQVERFRQDNFEDLHQLQSGMVYFLNIDGMTCGAKDETCLHRVCKSSSLLSVKSEGLILVL